MASHKRRVQSLERLTRICHRWAADERLSISSRREESQGRKGEWQTGPCAKREKQSMLSDLYFACYLQAA